MRTTLTLDDAVAARVKDEMRRSGASFKDTVERLLRLGLEAAHQQPRLPPFQVRPQPLQPRVHLDYDNVGELLEQAEGPWHR
jgi:hypothetical protein